MGLRLGLRGSARPWTQCPGQCPVSCRLLHLLLLLLPPELAVAFTVASCSVINLSLLLRPELWGPGKGVKGPSGATVPWRGRTGLSPVLGAGSCARLCWLQPESPGWRWPGPALSLAASRLRPARGSYSLGSDGCGRLWRMRRVRRVRRAQGARAAPRSLQPAGAGAAAFRSRSLLRSTVRPLVTQGTYSCACVCLYVRV